MMSTGERVSAAPERSAQPGTGSHSRRYGPEGRGGHAVQDWPDGSKYEGEFVNGLKHGRGRYTWRNGERYEGSFYKDYRHGDGVHCWPSGHKFTGKFYLNRKEGYGQQLFPDGATFQGLYHSDQRFGPGVVSYPDGCQDVGLWLGPRLLKLCTSVEDGFSIKSLPEYAGYMDPAVTTAGPQSQPPISSSDPPTKARTGSEVDTAGRSLLSDDHFILPSGMESYSADGDHLPLPPGRRRELDQHFYGELWEPDTRPYQGYKRDPLSSLPLKARLLSHIHKQRLLAVNVDWDVAAVLSLNRDNFGPKGPLEVRSELLIQQASRGELKAASQILQTGLVHPDVADSQGHTALIAATVNCRHNVIHLLLDMGADIDKLNSEGMSALAVCHVLYYPHQSLYTTFAEPAAKTQVLRSQSRCSSRPQISGSPLDFTADTSSCSSRPRTADATPSNLSHLSDPPTEELAELVSHPRNKVSKDPELTPTGLREHMQKEERDSDANVRDGEGCYQTWGGGDREGMSLERDFNKIGEKDADVKFGEERKIKNKDDKLREEVWGGQRDFNEDAVEEGEDGGKQEDEVTLVERSIQVMDGPVALGSVKWKERRTEASRRVQEDKEEELTPKQSFDSACSVNSYDIQVTEEDLQRSAEALSRTGIRQDSVTQETVRTMAAMKAEHRVRLSTLKLLLERGADPNTTRVPMPVLFLAIMAADTEAVRRLLLCGARTDIPLPPERKGLYPLHVAAALPGPAGPRATELLLHAVTDPDAQACDQDEVFDPDKVSMQEPLLPNQNPDPREGGRTALHVACQRDSDHANASKVVSLLLSHRARTDLLWSGHAPLSLAIASGNAMAVEELLKGGADPNVPLGPRVGSALCALANINYRSCFNRAELLDILAEAGADVLMPVRVGGVVGTAVDYAHHSFNQRPLLVQVGNDVGTMNSMDVADSRIANTPFHALNMQEKETFKARRQLLSMMGDLLRHAARQREREKVVLNSEDSISSTDPNLSRKRLPPITDKHWNPLFKFCYQCGRCAAVKLRACSRCRRVFYCSRTCKLNSWEDGHKEECVRTSASADGLQKTAAFKTQRFPKPWSTAEEEAWGSQLNLKENYSCN